MGICYGIFYCFEFVVLLCILIVYVLIFWIVLILINFFLVKYLKVELIRVRRFFFIVLMDFFCWMLVIIIGILFLSGNFYDLKYEVKVWIVVFVLFVNFVINLILYIFFILGV